VFLSPEEVLDWAVQIARGMNYLHNESPVSVVHRDLKSANVLLANAGVDSEVQTLGNVLKITDFGLARKFVGSLNESGSFGTCQWMAPETVCLICCPIPVLVWWGEPVSHAVLVQVSHGPPLVFWLG
jgi:serine/threonine protein kinase